MTVLWTTSELSGLAFDPEPDDGEDDDGAPWRRWSRDLWGQRVGSDRLDHMTDVPTGEYL